MLKKMLERIKRKNRNYIKTAADNSKTRIRKNLDENIKIFREILGESSDVILRKIKIGGTNAAVLYLEGLADNEVVNDFILKPLLLGVRQTKPSGKLAPKELFLKIKENSVPIGEISEAEDFDKLVSLFLTGVSAVLVDGFPKALMLNTKGWEKRSITDPDIEKVIKGPRDGFTETLRVNTTLVRRRLRDPNLRVINLQIGRRSKTDVAVIYIEDIANPDLVKEVKKRLEKMT